MPTLPEGNFIYSQSGNKVKWYTGNNPNYQYIQKNNRKFAEQLAYRKYLNLQLSETQKELYSLNNYIHTLSQPSKSNQLLQSSEYRQLISPFYTPEIYELANWQSQSYDKNSSHPENLIHKSISGNLLRSKSEAIIDSLLFQNKIPFRYECQLVLGDRILYPDFTIRHPITGNLYYWEHFGLMDNADYSKKACEKLQLYVTYGIIPTITLITTFETKTMPLTIQKVSQVIQEYFL